MPSIKKTASGNYHTSVFIGMVNGKRKYKSITAPTKREVKQQIAEALTENITESTYGALTLAQAIERYIKSKSNTLSPSTLRGYKTIQKNDFQRLKDYRLDDLNTDIIQTAVNELSAVNSPKTVRNKYNLISSVIKSYAPDLKLRVRLPQKIKPTVHIHTEQTIHELLAHCDDRLRVPILLAAFGGLRRSEICALTPEDFSADGVRISKAKVYGDNGYIIKQPKSDAGYRFVPLSKDIIKEAKAWKHFGMNPDVINNAYQTLHDNLGIPATFHKLRHFYGTELLRNGIDLLTACQYGGWEDPNVLLKIYAHATRTEQTDNKVISIYSAYQNNQSLAKHG